MVAGEFFFGGGGKQPSPRTAGGAALLPPGDAALLPPPQSGTYPIYVAGCDVLQHGPCGRRGAGSGSSVCSSSGFLHHVSSLLRLKARHPIVSPGALANWETGLMTCLLIWQGGSLIGGEELYSVKIAKIILLSSHNWVGSERNALRFEPTLF